MKYYYDKKSTISSWPIQIHCIEELKECYQSIVLSVVECFKDYIVIYNPKVDYVVGYGMNIIFYIDHQLNLKIINRDDIVEIETFKELLEASITIKSQDVNIKLSYITSTYYLYDPLLHYALHCEDISFKDLERQYPKSKALYIDSLCMYNYCTYAYRLGNQILNYDYTYKNRREKWMPWKIHKEEWLSIDNTKGIFECYSYKYIIQCLYKLKR